MQPNRRYIPHLRTALVLTGTGTAGAYHAGVIRALHEAGVKVDLVAGRGMAREVATGDDVSLAVRPEDVHVEDLLPRLDPLLLERPDRLPAQAPRGAGPGGARTHPRRGTPRSAPPVRREAREICTEGRGSSALTACTTLDKIRIQKATQNKSAQIVSKMCLTIPHAI